MMNTNNDTLPVVPRGTFDASLTLGFPQVPRGAACKWAWHCCAAKIYFGVNGHEQIIAASHRLLKWRSGNWSSRAKPIVSCFERLRAELELELARDGVATFAARHVEPSRPNGRKIINAVSAFS